jgi:hypothetical protein
MASTMAKLATRKIFFKFTVSSNSSFHCAQPLIVELGERCRALARPVMQSQGKLTA